MLVISVATDTIKIERGQFKRGVSTIKLISTGLPDLSVKKRKQRALLDDNRGVADFEVARKDVLKETTLPLIRLSSSDSKDNQAQVVVRDIVERHTAVLQKVNNIDT